MPAHISGMESVRSVTMLVAARTRDNWTIVATVERAAPATAALMVNPRCHGADRGRARNEPRCETCYRETTTRPEHANEDVTRGADRHHQK